MTPTDFVTFAHRGSTTGANALQQAAIYVSHDAGRSWLAFRLPAAGLKASFADPQHGWLVAAGANGDTEALSLYATSDGGADWRLVSGPKDFFDGWISFVSPNDGFVSDSHGRLFRTADAGATWLQVQR